MANQQTGEAEPGNGRSSLSRLLLRTVLASTAFTALSITGSAAYAGPRDVVVKPDDKPAPNVTGGAIFVSGNSQQLAQAPLPPKANGSRQNWTCRFYLAIGTSSPSSYVDRDGNSHLITDPVTPVKGAGYQLMCFDESGALVYQNDVIYDPGNPGAMLDGDAGAFARDLQAAYTQLAAPPPALVAAPPLEGRSVVGVKTWFWLRAWEDLASPVADAAGYQLRFAATPTRLVIDPGDGSGPMAPCTPDNAPEWRPRAEGGPADTGCGHTYHQRSADQPGGAFTITATVSYDVHWTATAPDGTVFDQGDLPAIPGTATFPITVHEIQAVGHA